MSLKQVNQSCPYLWMIMRTYDGHISVIDIRARHALLDYNKHT
jgi:hypothetical protein